MVSSPYHTLHYMQMVYRNEFKLASFRYFAISLTKYVWMNEMNDNISMKGWLEWYCWKMNDPVSIQGWGWGWGGGGAGHWPLHRRNPIAVTSSTSHEITIKRYQRTPSHLKLNNTFHLQSNRTLYKLLIEMFTFKHFCLKAEERIMEADNWKVIDSILKYSLAKLENWVGSCWAVIRVIMNHFIIHSKFKFGTLSQNVFKLNSWTLKAYWIHQTALVE